MESKSLYIIWGNIGIKKKKNNNRKTKENPFFLKKKKCFFLIEKKRTICKSTYYSQILPPTRHFCIHSGRCKNKDQQKWMTHMLHTSLCGGHVERDNLAVCGEREFGGEDLAGHSHWAASDLEGLL